MKLIKISDVDGRQLIRAEDIKKIYFDRNCNTTICIDYYDHKAQKIKTFTEILSSPSSCVRRIEELINII